MLLTLLTKRSNVLLLVIGLSLLGNVGLWVERARLKAELQASIAGCNADKLESALAASEAARRTITERFASALEDREKALRDAQALSEANLALRAEIEQTQGEAERRIREALRDEPEDSCANQPVGNLWLLVKPEGDNPD